MTFVLRFNAGFSEKINLGLKIYVEVSNFALKVNFPKKTW